MGVREPDFLVIGGMRCATGWIRQCLKEHPEVYMPREEIHFFDAEYERGLDWYLKFFEGWSIQKAVGEKTATYLNEGRAPERMAKHFPKIKLVCCIRDPIERIYSHYMMNKEVKESIKNTRFEELATLDSEYFRRSLYFTHITNYLKHFPVENMLVLVYEDKDRAPNKFMREIFRFIGVDEFFKPPSANIQTKRGAFEYSNIVWKTVSSIFLHPRSPQIMKRLYSKIRPHSPEAEIDDNVYRTLSPFFAEEIRGLENLLDRRLSCWRTREYIDI